MTIWAMMGSNDTAIVKMTIPQPEQNAGAGATIFHTMNPAVLGIRWNVKSSSGMNTLFQ